MGWRWKLLGLLGLTLFAVGCGSSGEAVGRLNNSNTAVRLAAAREVAQEAAATGIQGYLVALSKGSPGKAVVEALIQRLKDPSSEVRAMAAKALGNLERRQAVQGLLEALKDETPIVRLEAAASLGKIRDRRAIPTLAGVLDNPDLRLTVIWALGNIGDREAVSLLLPFTGSEDKYLRYNAMQALKKLK